MSAANLRDDGVGGDDVLHLLGPGVHEAEPPAPQRDEGAVFDLEFVTVGVDLLPHLQHCGTDAIDTVSKKTPQRLVRFVQSLRH